MTRAGRVIAVVLVAGLGCANPSIELLDRPLDWTFQERFRLGAQPSGPESFFQLSAGGVATSSDGRVLVLDRPNYRVLEFDSAGSFVQMFGRRGQGPGELEFPAYVLATTGGTAVFDAYKRALLVFDGGGQLLERVDVGTPSPNGIAFVGDALVFGAQSRTDDGMVRDELRVARGGDTTILTSLERQPSTVQDHLESCQVRMSAPPVFAPVLSWSAAGKRLAVALPPAYAVEVWNDLQQTFDVHRPIEPILSSDQLARQHLGDGVKIGIGMSRTCTIPTDEVIRLRGIAPFVPVLRGVSVSPGGELWVGRYTLGDEAQRTDIFDASGSYVGTLRGPHPSPVAFFPSGGFVSIEENAVGEHELVAYDVERH